MFSWCLQWSWNPPIPFYPLPPSVLHPASLATYCSHWHLEPFLVSKAGRTQVPLAMIIRMHPGRHPPRVILQSEQHYSEAHCVYMDRCLSCERGCSHYEIVHVDFTLVKFHSGNSFSLVEIFQMFCLGCTNRKAWLLTPVQEGMRYK